MPFLGGDRDGTATEKRRVAGYYRARIASQSFVAWFLYCPSQFFWAVSFSDVITSRIFLHLPPHMHDYKTVFNEWTHGEGGSKGSRDVVHLFHVDPCDTRKQKSTILLHRDRVRGAFCSDICMNDAMHCDAIATCFDGVQHRIVRKVLHCRPNL